MYCAENRWRLFCLLRIIHESGVYQLGVPQGQGDSSAPSTSDPLICGFCLLTTPNTRGKTVEQSIVIWMFAREFITNRHPVAPQLTNKPSTNRRLKRKTQMYCDENRWRLFCLLRIIHESRVYQLGVPQGQGDSSAPSTTDPLICGQTDRQMDKRTRWNQYTPTSTSLKPGV